MNDFLNITRTFHVRMAMGRGEVDAEQVELNL